MENIYNMVDIETIKELSKLVKDNELSEITIVDGGKTITIKGKKCPTPPPFMPPMGMPMAAPMSAMTNEITISSDTPAKETKVISGNVVKSPIVGTFYEASAPDKPPFVTVGKAVKKGDVLMIIESMKLMNEVMSDFDGVVEEILVKNGDAVEFDQPIMIIK